MRTLLLSLLLACGGGGSGPPDAAEEGAGNEAPPEPVTVVEVAAVAEGSVADVLVASAVVESEASADIVPESIGVVREIRRDEGDVVARGDILAILDNVSLGTGAAKATAEVRRLQQQVDEAKALLTRGAISVREVEDLEFQLQTSRMSSQEARRTYGTTRLTAPFAGVVAMRDVRVGELATSKAAFQIVDPDKLRVVASVPERDLGRISIGQPVRLVSAYDSDVWANGVVQRMSPVVDASSGTFRVTVGVTDPARLRPGQFVSVQIEVDRREGVIVVPRPAVVYEDGVPVVYRVADAPPPEEDESEENEEQGGSGWWPFSASGEPEEEEEGEGDDAEPDEDEGPKKVSERVLVSLGLVDEVSAEVKDGLTRGDEVIVVGQSHLRDGNRVRVVSPDDADETDDTAETDAAPSAEATGSEG